MEDRSTQLHSNKMKSTNSTNNIQKSTANIYSIRYFLYGYLAGFAGIIVSHPFDTMKSCIQEDKPIKYNLRHLYKGVTAPLVGVGIEKAVVFGTFENTINYTNSNFISGALSGLNASLVVTPFERVKIILQVGNTFSIKNLHKLSFGYLYQGFSATLTRETPGFAIYFSVYNNLKRDQENLPPLKSFLYGACAGIFSWIFIYPQDRIKTHLQALADKKMNFVESFREILAKGGYKGFYKGFSYALMRSVPLHATAFTTMEFCKNIFDK